MKKLVAMVMAVAMSISCFVITASAVDFNENGGQSVSVSAVQPREILTYTKTQKVYVGSLAAKVTLQYTTRSESGNSSGEYITGVKSISIAKVSGWTSVRNVKVTRMAYSNNHQKADAYISYEGSVGSGYTTYDDVIHLSLL